MSQRGGDVQSNLRIADRPINSDLIASGNADVIISLEPMEALRYLPYLSREGCDHHLFGPLRQYTQLSRRKSTESRIAKTAPCHHARCKRIGKRTQSPQMCQCNIAWSRSQIVANHRVLRSRKKHRPRFCPQRPSRHRNESQSSIDRV